MTINHFTSSIELPASPQQVFDCIKDVQTWWSKDFQGKSASVDDDFIINHPGLHYSRQRLVEAIPGKRLVWLVTESELNWLEKDKQEWTNTKLIFALTPNGKTTLLHFTHEGLVPEKESYAMCSKSWNEVIRERFLKLVTDKNDTI